MACQSRFAGLKARNTEKPADQGLVVGGALAGVMAGTKVSGKEALFCAAALSGM